MDPTANAHLERFRSHDAFRSTGCPANTVQLALYYDWLHDLAGPNLMGVRETCSRLAASYLATPCRVCLEQEIEVAALLWEAYGRVVSLLVEAYGYSLVPEFAGHADKVVSRTVTLEFRHDS